MAPYNIDQEVDVYLVPHLRMKELVNDCKVKCDTTNFTTDDDLEQLLSNLIRTFVEFKNHEMIENNLIMKKLKNKLKKLSIRNTAVCNCHKDSHLIDMLKMLKEGYGKKTKQDRANYGIQLRNSIEEFAEDFLPHMKEEEETFGPLLQKYFTYDELKDLRSKVIDKHLEQKDHVVEDILAAEELEKWALEQQIKEGSSSSACESDIDARSAVDELMRLKIRDPKPPDATISDLPPEVLLNVMSHLNPQDLCRSSQVCKQWSSVAMDPSLWKHLHPVEWARGDWEFRRCYGSNHEEDDDDDYSGCYQGDSAEQYVVIDDDADTDESEMPDDAQEEQDEIIRQVQKEGRILLGLKNHIVPRLGDSVRTLNLANSQALTSGVLQKLLMHCPNIETLDLSHTRISDPALKGVGKGGCCSNLKHLILTGCHNITDVTLMRVAMAINKPLIGQDYMSDTSGDEVSGAILKELECVCSKYENMKQKMKHCDHSDLCQEKNGETLNQKEKNSCLVDMDKDIDETMATEKGGECDRTDEHDNERSCDMFGGNGGNRGNWFDKTLYGFYGDPRDFCREVCAAAKPGATHTWDNIEDWGSRGPPGGCYQNHNESVMVETPFDNRNKGLFIEDHEMKNEGDIDKRPAHGEVSLEYLSLSGCYKITDKGLSALYGYGPLPRVKHLDLSGCMNLSSPVLTELVEACAALDETRLYYCDNILDGPCATTANGCNNVGCSMRFCCRT